MAGIRNHAPKKAAPTQEDEEAQIEEEEAAPEVGHPKRFRVLRRNTSY